MDQLRSFKKINKISFYLLLYTEIMKFITTINKISFKSHTLKQNGIEKNKNKWNDNHVIIKKSNYKSEFI